LLPLVAVVLLLFVVLQRVPSTYPPAAHPLPPPDLRQPLGGGLAGFESPYLGHTGSWNGRGGAGIGSKIHDLDAEREMGLRWTFMPVYWRKLEPDGPVDLRTGPPPPWRELDDFVIAAHARGLNVLMQAPVVGGNAGGPPRWAGVREQGKSAPQKMEALADFAGKLAARYAPDGVLARREGWGATYGVRAWELDNEPNDYLVSWKGQAADYAEFVTKAAASIRKADRQAVIVAPGVSGGKDKQAWLEQALDAAGKAGSPEFRQRGVGYSVGPATDVVSFHLYEGLDTAFSGTDRTMERVFTETREPFEKWEGRTPGFRYPHKQEYWHTEGSFDFFGVLSAERRAAWRFQFNTRAFAAGVRKVIVMDASPKEQVAMRAYVRALPDPFPMLRANEQVTVTQGKAVAFRHLDRSGKPGDQVWVLWAVAGLGEAEVEVPVHRPQVEGISVQDEHFPLKAVDGKVRVRLRGDAKMAPPLLILDRAPEESARP
jgi:hypothetical protein